MVPSAHLEQTHHTHARSHKHTISHHHYIHRQRERSPRSARAQRKHIAPKDHIIGGTAAARRTGAYLRKTHTKYICHACLASDIKTHEPRTLRAQCTQERALTNVLAFRTRANSAPRARAQLSRKFVIFWTIFAFLMRTRACDAWSLCAHSQQRINWSVPWSALCILSAIFRRSCGGARATARISGMAVLAVSPHSLQHPHLCVRLLGYLGSRFAGHSGHMSQCFDRFYQECFICRQVYGRTSKYIETQRMVLSDYIVHTIYRSYQCGFIFLLKINTIVYTAIYRHNCWSCSPSSNQINNVFGRKNWKNKILLVLSRVFDLENNLRLTTNGLQSGKWLNISQKVLWH